MYTAELMKMFGAVGNPTFKPVGTHKVKDTADGNVHEGYGGWKYQDFVEKYEPNPEPGSHARCSSPFVFEPRIYGVAVVSGNSIYIVGGLSKTGDYTSTRNTIWRWNSKSRRKGWDILPPFPGLGLISLAVRGQKIYVFGGAKTGGKDMINSNGAFVFDCRTERWTGLPDLPFARRCWWAVPLDGKVLLVGGYADAYEKEVCEYDLVSRSLRQVGVLPHGVCDAKFLRIGNSLIGAGGEVGNKIRGNWTFESQLLFAWNDGSAR